MNQDYVLEAAAGRGLVAWQSEAFGSGGAGKKQAKMRAFKFGGSSLLGAERMLHASRLVRDATKASKVAVAVSAMPLAVESEMVVWIRNTFNPQARGTRIGPAAGEFSGTLPLGGAA